MDVLILKRYIEYCTQWHEIPTFEGLKNYKLELDELVKIHYTK